MDMSLVVVVVGVTVGGLAAIVGMWMERDPRRPKHWAWALSALILLATVGVGFDAYMSFLDEEKMKEDMARMLQMLDGLAADSGDEDLRKFISSELAAQARSNPDVVQKLAQRVSDEGGDPADVLTRHLPDSEVESLARKGGLETEKKGVTDKKKAEKKPTEEPEPVRTTEAAEVVRPIGRGVALGASPGEADGGAPSPRGIELGPGLALPGARGAGAASLSAVPKPGKGKEGSGGRADEGRKGRPGTVVLGGVGAAGSSGSGGGGGAGETSEPKKPAAHVGAAPSGR